MKGMNPNNPKQARLFYDLIEACEYGEKRHPVVVMEELAKKYGFKILDRVPQSLFDGWDFWIEFEELPNLPPIFRDVPWKRVGQA
jgi:hypothetical protein